MTAKEQNDFFYVCSLIEYVARIKQKTDGGVVEKSEKRDSKTTA